MSRPLHNSYYLGSNVRTDPSFGQAEYLPHFWSISLGILNLQSRTSPPQDLSVSDAFRAVSEEVCHACRTCQQFQLIRWQPMTSSSHVQRIARCHKKGYRVRPKVESKIILIQCSALYLSWKVRKHLSCWVPRMYGHETDTATRPIVANLTGNAIINHFTEHYTNYYPQVSRSITPSWGFFASIILLATTYPHRLPNHSPLLISNPGSCLPGLRISKIRILPDCGRLVPLGVIC